MPTARTRGTRLASIPSEISLREYRPGDPKIVVYLIHIEPRLHGAGHYVGSCVAAMLPARMRRHTRGQGARLLRAALAAGCRLDLVRVWRSESRELERSIKDKRRNAALCPRCNPSLTKGRTYNSIPLPNRMPLTASWTAAQWETPTFRKPLKP